MYHYAAFKICLGPEEERNRTLEKMRVPDGMAACRKKGQGGRLFAFCILQVILWLILLQEYGADWYFLLCGICCGLLSALSMVDLAIYELPPELNLLIAFCGAGRLMTDLEHWYEYLIGAVLVSGLFLAIGLISGGRAMGFGDVKMMAALGLFLGWKKILLVLLLACVLGVLIHGLRMIISKKEHVLAFGPYLALGAVIAMILGDRVIDWYIGTFFTF